MVCVIVCKVVAYRAKICKLNLNFSQTLHIARAINFTDTSRGVIREENPTRCSKLLGFISGPVFSWCFVEGKESSYNYTQHTLVNNSVHLNCISS